MPRYVGLLGHPVGHSISPIFQQAAFNHCGLDIRYEPWETDPEDLEATLEQARGRQCVGMNVTIPYKEAIMPLLDERDSLARRVGAVNTVVNRNGRLTGYNTDAEGFMLSLLLQAGFRVRDKRVVILGAGGASRAISYALMSSEIRSLTIINRTVERAQDIIDSLPNSSAETKALPWNRDGMAEAIARCHLLVNATPVGMKHTATEGQSPIDAELIPRRILVYDLVYNPPETPLLVAAKQAGAYTQGGLGMLVYQGASSFELWTDQDAPVEVMFEAAQRALGGT